MARAGVCSGCGREVWVLEDGRCQFGHEATCLSGIREADPSPEPEAQRGRPHRGWIWFLVIAAVLLVIFIGTTVAAGTMLVRSALTKTQSVGPLALTDAWRLRIARDYPDWKLVDFYVVKSDSSDGPTTDYWVTFIPPGERYRLATYYVSANRGEAASQDEVFRATGTFHQWAPQLLKYVDDHYYREGLSVISVTSDSDGNAYVTWQKPRDVSSSAIHVDAVTLDTVDGVWSLLPED